MTSIVGPFLSFEKALEDTPTFRTDLAAREKSLIDLEKQINELIKRADKSLNSCHAMAKNGVTLSAELQAFASYDEDDPETTCAYAKFASSLRDIEHHRCLFIENMKSSLVEPLRQFNESTVKDFKKSKKVFDQISNELDSTHSRYAGSSPKKPQEVEQNLNQLNATKSIFTYMSLDHVHQINLALGKTRFEILEKSVAYMYSLMAFYHQSYDSLKDLEPFLKIITSSLAQRRESFNNVAKSMEMRHELVNTRQEKHDNLIAQQANGLVQEVKILENRSTNSLDNKNLQVNSSNKLTVPNHLPTSKTRTGYLFAKGVNKEKRYKRYYVFVKDNQIWFQSRQPRSVPFSGASLHLCTVKNVPNSTAERIFTFELITPMNTITLQAQNQQIKDAWISCLQSHISDALDNQTSPKNTNNDGGDSASGLSPDIIDEINSVKGNDICCDCGAAGPSWASINFGVLLCIECSGVHRRLGTHISKVRSLTLDKWEPESIEVMKTIGNKRFNDIFLSKIPPNQQIPKENAERALRSEWIVSKYSLKSFVEKKSDETDEFLQEQLFKNCENETNLCEVVKLFAKGVDINRQLKSFNNFSPMHVCAKANNAVTAEFLYQNFASLDARDNDDRTPLHVSAISGNNRFVGYLLKRSARYDLTDKDDLTACQLALAGEHVETVTQLRIFELNKAEEESMRINEEYKRSASGSSLNKLAEEGWGGLKSPSQTLGSTLAVGAGSPLMSPKTPPKSPKKAKEKWSNF